MAQIPDELAGKLHALRERTRDRGCTEAEALAAASILQELLDKHGLSLADLDAMRRPGGRPEMVYGGVRTPFRPVNHTAEMVMAVARFFDVIWVNQTTVNKHKLWAYGEPVYFGLPTDVEAAVALNVVIQRAMRDSWDVFRKARTFPNLYRQTLAAKWFQWGMSSRIMERLDAMREHFVKVRNSRALVVLKSEIVAAAAKDNGVVGVQLVSGGKLEYDEAAYGAGTAAGELVELGPRPRLAA